MREALSKVGKERGYLLIQSTHQKSIASVIFKGETLSVFPLQLRARQKCPFTNFNQHKHGILEVLATETRQEK